MQYKDPKSSGSKESAGELASERHSVSAGLEYLAKPNDMCVAKAVPYKEIPQWRAAEMAGLEALAMKNLRATA